MPPNMELNWRSSALRYTGNKDTMGLSNVDADKISVGPPPISANTIIMEYEDELLCLSEMLKETIAKRSSESLFSGYQLNENQIAELTLRRAIAPGDNYCSSIYRAKIPTKDGASELTFLYKTLPKEKAMAEAVVKGKHFEREIAMLAVLIPKMQLLLERVSPGRNPPFAAKCFLHDSSSPFLMLEDLKPQGFRLAERHRGLGLRHSLMALRALARFHAASAALLQQDPDVPDSLSNPMRCKGTTFENFTAKTQRLAAGACDKWPGFEEYGAILGRFWPIALEKFGELTDQRPGRFNVIVHGDYWVNNIMFKYDDTYPYDIRMVDFQISHVASPAIDLLYFLSTSTSDDVSEKHEDLLIREYYFELAQTMTLLRLTPPSLQELLLDIDAHGLYALFGCLGVLPLVRAEFAPDLGEAMYECPAVRKWLQRMLPMYKRRGWLRL